MTNRHTKATIYYEDRGEAIKYQLANREILASCTHGKGMRLYADSIRYWESSKLPVSDDERLRIIKEIISWMTIPGLIRRILRIERRTVILVVDDEDTLRSSLSMIPSQMTVSGIPVELEHDNLQKRKDFFDSIILSDLKAGRGRIIIQGKVISSPSEYLSIKNRHDGFVK